MSEMERPDEGSELSDTEFTKHKTELIDFFVKRALEREENGDKDITEVLQEVTDNVERFEKGTPAGKHYLESQFVYLDWEKILSQDEMNVLFNCYSPLLRNSIKDLSVNLFLESQLTRIPNERLFIENFVESVLEDIKKQLFDDENIKVSFEGKEHKLELAFSKVKKRARNFIRDMARQEYSMLKNDENSNS